MDFDRFAEEIIKELENRLGSGYTVCRQDLRKNNGILHRTVVVSDGRNAAAPCYRLEPYYHVVYRGPDDIRAIAGDIIQNYQKDRERNFTLEWVADRKQALDRVVFRLAGVEGNGGLLENMPHHVLPGLGLAVVFYMLLDDDGKNSASIPVWNRHMDLWGVTETELLEHAEKNTPEAMGLSIRRMGDVLREAAAGLADGMPFPEAPFPVYVLSNRQYRYGAGCILYPGVLEGLREKNGSGFYILPGSVHEVLAVPADRPDSQQTGKLKKMVMEVNCSVLEREEVLSDHVYYYDGPGHGLVLMA